MTQDHSTVLTDLRAEKLRLFCDRCGLQKRYDVSALMNKLGNAKVTPLLDELAKRGGCPASVARKIKWHDAQHQMARIWGRFDAV